MTGWRAWALTAVGFLLVLPGAAINEIRHTTPDAAYFRAVITAVEPAAALVKARVDPAGEWIEVANDGAAEVVVLGYQNEPYLRINTDGVAENLLSESTYLNRALFAELPDSGPNSTVSAQWHIIGQSLTARWHDHRIHWMGQGRPPAVAADPGHAHTVGTWTVRGFSDGAAFEVRGELRWIGRSGWRTGPTLLLIVAGNLPLLALAVAWPSLRRWRQRRTAARSVGAV